MAATTAGVPLTTVADLAMGKVPSICSVLSGGVPHGNLFAIPLDGSQFEEADPDSEFRLDLRIIHGWDWQMDQGVEYLQNLIKPIGPVESIAFAEATIDIGIPTDTWLKYSSRNMIPYYLEPLTKPAPLDVTLHHARRACDQLLGLYSFISLIRRKTLGKNTLIRCPEDFLNWRFHALYCPTGIRPRIDASDYADEANPFSDAATKEAEELARMQDDRIRVLLDQCEHFRYLIDAYKAKNNDLSRDLAEALSQLSTLRIEHQRSLLAVKRTLGRAQAAEHALTSFQFIMPQAPLPDSDGTSDSPQSCDSSPAISIISSSPSSANVGIDIKKN
ncbi:hypothetical protein FS837_008694 [Tulasnella sp. UAMH 9824]|nr:hypothetical protein FS837_008694 [Tulasnella sp. UAMH 9824]